jgi:hypothetical protein
LKEPSFIPSGAFSGLLREKPFSLFILWGVVKSPSPDDPVRRQLQHSMNSLSLSQKETSFERQVLTRLSSAHDP